MPCVKTAQCRDLILASRIQKSKCVVCRTEFYWHTLALSATDSIFWHFTTEEKYKYKNNGEHIENTEIRIHPLPLRLLFAAKPFWDICAPSYTSLCNMALLQWQSSKLGSSSFQLCWFNDGQWIATTQCSWVFPKSPASVILPQRFSPMGWATHYGGQEGKRGEGDLKKEGKLKLGWKENKGYCKF